LNPGVPLGNGSERMPAAFFRISAPRSSWPALAATARPASPFEKIIIEPTGSGVAIKSWTKYTGFFNTGLVGERVVLKKTSGGWKIFREKRSGVLHEPLVSLVDRLVDYTILRGS
jgi:hypothetical protein